MVVVQTLLDTCHKFADDDGFAFLHGCKIEGNILCCDSVFLRVRGIVKLLRAIEERFGRNTTYIEARTTERILLKKNHVFTCLGGLLRCGITRRTATYYG